MADLTSAATEFVQSIADAPLRFNDAIQWGDPVTAGMQLFLIALGALFVGGASAALGYLSLGAFFSLFTVENSGSQSP